LHVELYRSPAGRVDAFLTNPSLTQGRRALLASGGRRRLIHALTIFLLVRMFDASK